MELPGAFHHLTSYTQTNSEAGGVGGISGCIYVTSSCGNTAGCPRNRTL